MSKPKDPNLHYVSVQAAPVVLHKDIKKKIAEIRVKRDAIMLAHNKVNLDQDKYNKAIICLSLFSAFFESTKAQLNLSTRNDWIAPVSILMPILLSTILSIISSLMKFKKFNERIDLLSKATEKSNATVLNLRRLQESLNFQSYMQSYKDYSGPVTESYRDALDCYEKALYPHEHDRYMKEAIKIANTTRECEETHDNDIEKLLNEDKLERINNNDTYPNNIQLDSPDIESAVIKTEKENETESQNIKIEIKETVNNNISPKKEEISSKKPNKVIEMSKNINKLYKNEDTENDEKKKLKP